MARPPAGRDRPWVGRGVAAALVAGLVPAGTGAAGLPVPTLAEVAIAEAAEGFDAVAADTRDAGLLWAAAGSRVLASIDGGRSWRERFRLPGAGASGGTAADDESAAVAGPLDIDGDTEDDELAEDEIDITPGAAAGVARGRPEGDEGRSRIHGLRAGPGALWVAASDAAYRWSGPLAVESLERFGAPGDAPVFAVAPDPIRPGAAWLATGRGLLRVEGASMTRAPGSAGTTPARDVDVSSDGQVAVATERGLFLSTDGGRTFAGPLAVGSAGGPVAAVRLAMDGGIAAAPDGVLARFERDGRFEVLVEREFSGVRRLHVGEDGRVWFATAGGLFLRAGDGPAMPVTQGLPTTNIRDVVTPAGQPDRPLVAADRGLFLGGEDLRGAMAPLPPPGSGGSLPLLVRAAEEHLGLPRLEPGRSLALSSLLPGLDASWTSRSPASVGVRDVWAVVASWDLARLFGPAGFEATPAERRLYRARRALGLRVERALRACDRMPRGAKIGVGGVVEAALAFLSADEQEAHLGGLTGGWHRYSVPASGEWREGT